MEVFIYVIANVETWFEGDWLSTLFRARDGEEISKFHHVKKARNS